MSKMKIEEIQSNLRVAVTKFYQNDPDDKYNQRSESELNIHDFEFLHFRNDLTALFKKEQWMQ